MLHHTLKALVWMAIVLCSVCMLGIIILGAADAPYRVMGLLYTLFATGFLTLFGAGLIIAILPEEKPRS